MVAEYTAHDIARYIVEYSNKRGKPVTNLQLQKILFFLQCSHMRKHGGEPLFGDDFEAWKYGPVIPSVYFDYSPFGGLPITEPVTATEDAATAEPTKVRRIDQSCIEDIASELESLLSKPAWQLVSESHRQGGAWDVAFAGGRGRKSVIGKPLIAELCS